MTDSLTSLLSRTELLKLGFTAPLIKELLNRPDKVEHVSRGMYRFVKYSYSRDKVIAAMQDPRFVQRIERRKSRLATVAQRRAEIPGKYQAWQDALPEACAGMLSLNRYAKYRSCSPLHKNEIYRLKNELIELLYAEGYCTLAWIHRLQLAAQPCRDCNGLGGDCDRCDGAGTYRDTRTLEFWCFCFVIDSRPYCWHQPRATVEFSPTESVPPQDWQGLRQEEKPLTIPQHKFAAIKGLLRWLIDRAHADDQPAYHRATAAGSPPVSRQEEIPF